MAARHTPSFTVTQRGKKEGQPCVLRTNFPPVLTTAGYNANNQQTAFGTTGLTYDANGNLTGAGSGASATIYTWNARNQLIGISVTGFSASFSYDALGRRIGKTVQGVTTLFVYDGAA